jgi:hypothetical protein
MLVKKIITIKLTEAEVKKALLNYISESGDLPWSYVKHIKDNEFFVDFADGEFILCIDGEMDDEIPM